MLYVTGLLRFGWRFSTTETMHSHAQLLQHPDTAGTSSWQTCWGCRAWSLGFLAGQLAQQAPGSSTEADWLRDAAALLSLPAGETWNVSRLQGLGQALQASPCSTTLASKSAAAIVATGA